MLDVQAGHVLGCSCLEAWDRECLFAQSVYYYEDCVVAVNVFGQRLVVHCNMLPGMLWDWQWL